MAPFLEYSKKIAMWWYALAMIQPANSEPRGESPTLASEMGCWVFLHMPKSGGTTMKTMLRKAVKINFDQPQLPFTSIQYPKGASARRAAEAALRAGQGVVSGGYVEALRAYVSEDKCKWFTVFRHPVARLISAYFHCRFNYRNDQLCNKRTIDLDTIDILGFAEHWGNYGLRQFVLSFYPADDILSSPASLTCKGCAGWYMVKRYVEDLQQQSSANDTIGPLGDYQNDDPSLYRFLEPALEIISSRYAAVGILEDMNTTMYLFDRALGIPNFSWPVEIERIGAKNSDKKKKAEEHYAWLKFSADPSVKKFIWLDIILYEHALSVHAKQVKQYGLE